MPVKDRVRRLEIQRAYRQRHGDRLRTEAQARYYANHERNKERKRVDAAQRWSAKSAHTKRQCSLRWRYGLTYEEYSQMVVEQDNLCAVCWDLPDGKGGLVVDHDHVTGNIRGLLCTKCNSALGMVKDNLDTIAGMYSYLLAYEQCIT